MPLVTVGVHPKCAGPVMPGVNPGGQEVLRERWFMNDGLVSNAQPRAPNASPRVEAIRKNPTAQSMLSEIQRASPLPLAHILDEATFGPGPRHALPGPPREPSTPMLPVIRIEF